MTEIFTDHMDVEQKLDSLPLRFGDTMWLVGGFTGKQARIMSDRYGVSLTVFEPQTDLAKALANNLPQVCVYPFGLGAVTGNKPMAGKGTDACSFYTHIGGEATVGECVDVAAFLSVNDAPALAMLNCEGSEIDILDRLHETKLIKQFLRLLIQFHPQVVGEATCERVFRQLQETHTIIWRYWWGWIYAEAL